MPEDTPVEDELSPKDFRRMLSEANAATKAAEAKAEQMAREVAFRDAGINPTDPKAAYFTKGYDGPVDAEAIKAEAIKAGFLDQPVTPVPDTELAAMQAIATTAAGAGATAPDQDAEFLAAAYQATTQDELLAVYARFGVQTTTDAGQPR